MWRALTDAQEFGTWFRARLEGPFAVGKRVTGRITYPGYEHLTFELTVDRMEPEHHFSFRWHPYPADPKIDYSKETPTLVTFTLDEAKGGIELTVVESGFDKLRRRAATRRSG